MYKEAFIPVRWETKCTLDRIRKQEQLSFDAMILKMIHLYNPEMYQRYSLREGR
jgi:hypothetical protein